MFKVYFYLADGPDEPLGEEEYWLTAAPRKGDTVGVVYRGPEDDAADRNLIGKVVDLQWTVEKRDDQDNTGADWCTVDVWLEPLPQTP